MNTGSLEGKKKSQTTQTQTKATWGLGIIWGADIGGSMGQRRAGGGGQVQKAQLQNRSGYLWSKEDAHFRLTRFSRRGKLPGSLGAQTCLMVGPEQDFIETKG